jgi:CRISPR/Cas system-associated exonuclease Cas4 (RecB family)
LTVVDYKTSAKAAPVAEAAESLQLGFYVLAAQRDAAVHQLGEVNGAELWYPMAKTKKVTTRRFEMDRLDEIESRLNGIAHGIKQEDWSPNPGPHCGRCSLRPLCPAWAEGGPEFE